MSTVTNARRTLNAWACFALIDLAYALRDGRVAEEALPAGLTVEAVKKGHDCIMEGPIERKTLDTEVRDCVGPLIVVAHNLKVNDPDTVIVADTAGKPLLTARHLEYARRASEPMSEGQAKALLARRTA